MFNVKSQDRKYSILSDNETNNNKKTTDPKEIVKKIKESKGITFGEFRKLGELHKQGKLDLEQEKTYMEELKKFTKLVLPKIPQPLLTFFDMSKVSPTFNAFTNIEKTTFGQQLKKVNELSKDILKDITPLNISEIRIPNTAIGKSKIYEMEMKKINKNLEKINSDQDQIKTQTKPPTKSEKRKDTIIGIIIGAIGSSIVYGISLLVQYLQTLPPE